jgi:hypothetical protein
MDLLKDSDITSTHSTICSHIEIFLERIQRFARILRYTWTFPWVWSKFEILLQNVIQFARILRFYLTTSMDLLEYWDFTPTLWTNCSHIEILVKHFHDLLKDWDFASTISTICSHTKIFHDHVHGFARILRFYLNTSTDLLKNWDFTPTLRTICSHIEILLENFQRLSRILTLVYPHFAYICIESHACTFLFQCCIVIFCDRCLLLRLSPTSVMRPRRCSKTVVYYTSKM